MYCPKCGKPIEPKEKSIFPTLGGLGGAVGGGYIGSHIGLAALGTAMSGLIPLALVGSAVSYLLLKDFRQCPSCKDYFKV